MCCTTCTWTELKTCTLRVKKGPFSAIIVHSIVHSGSYIEWLKKVRGTNIKYVVYVWSRPMCATSSMGLGCPYRYRTIYFQPHSPALQPCIQRSDACSPKSYALRHKISLIHCLLYTEQTAGFKIFDIASISRHFGQLSMDVVSKLKFRYRSITNESRPR